MTMWRNKKIVLERRDENGKRNHSIMVEVESHMSEKLNHSIYTLNGMTEFTTMKKKKKEPNVFKKIIRTKIAYK